MNPIGRNVLFFFFFSVKKLNCFIGDDGDGTRAVLLCSHQTSEIICEIDFLSIFLKLN